MTAPTETKPQETAADTGTEYVVLQKVMDATGSVAASHVWSQIGKSSARSADAAIREIVGKLAEVDRKGTFVAIAARSFKPVTVSEKVERTLVIGS